MIVINRPFLLWILFVAAFFLTTGCNTSHTGVSTKSVPVLVLEDPPETLAILPFENNSVTEPEKYAPLSKGMSAMLITDLNRAGTSVKLIEREKIQTLLKEIALGQSGTVDQTTAVQVGKLLGAQSIAFGAFMVLDTTVRIDLRIINVETSELILADNVTGGSSNFIRLEQDLAQRIANSLKIALKPQKTPDQSDILAALYFSQGIEAHDAGDQEKAKKMFGQAVSIDPSYRDKIQDIDGY